MSSLWASLPASGSSGGGWPCLLHRDTPPSSCHLLVGDLTSHFCIPPPLPCQEEENGAEEEEEEAAEDGEEEDEGEEEGGEGKGWLGWESGLRGPASMIGQGARVGVPNWSRAEGHHGRGPRRSFLPFPNDPFLAPQMRKKKRRMTKGPR